ncbi:hypothetical protein G6F57_017691 [Rhizopus arrhizus]|uniref:Uncharacterized protein n=1 Tax=Rhizopus delemar TaxID=936053 RepID=A0A9P6YHK4_9FUNG|nr:hypothetical protein G6F65_022771 [Rhizopus arrhizus]KAG1251784.1 hypothetical protein G6F68_012102 [Rhizopus microsporus]KAG1434338.1 hypothetical protein G6F55_014558 [Rhizopus delemar]KAG1307118.1 hypothetical protein G6F62_015282 [Rhizopus arrhizus]KAG1444934.1 hypothetical protein G6F57_017691 [Rhizopus arrhizus]
MRKRGVNAPRKKRSGDLGQAQHRQRQIVGGACLGQQLAGHVQAGTAGGTTAGTHGQFGHRADAIAGGFADLVVGDSVADADVHRREPG